MTGSAFTLAFQSCVGQVGGVIGPQLFQSRFAYNAYKTPFAICTAVYDVLRVRRLRSKEKQGRIYASEDIQVYKERQFYEGMGRKKEQLEV
ncbi:hypothetical protein BDW60DRAFT_207085 [Aspergillus nidulans var. acristatus]